MVINLSGTQPQGTKKGSTASRPASPVIGDLYYNTELKDLEQYTEDGWMLVAKQVPRVPAIGSANLDGSNNASVSFTPSAYGQPASSYTVQSNPGSYTATGSSSPISISGSNLEVGTPYTFRVRSVGSYGQSAYSTYTSSVTPISIGSYESIATVTVGSGGQSSIVFTSIPATYTHLQIRGISRGAQVATNFMRFNGDTNSNYSTHYMFGDGTNVASGIGISDKMYAFFSTTVSGFFGGAIIDILDYANTNKNKTIRSLSGGDENASGYAEFLSGSWRNTNAITSITLIPGSGNIAEYSRFALYGIKGA